MHKTSKRLQKTNFILLIFIAFYPTPLSVYTISSLSEHHFRALIDLIKIF